MADLAELQLTRAKAVIALHKILESQKYEVGQGGNKRSNERASLEQVQALIKDLDAQIATATAQATPGARRMYNATPTSL